jgi:glycosyltransferase involved in cell wall biosynthesis
LVQGFSRVCTDERIDLCVRLSRLKNWRPGLLPSGRRFRVKIIQEPFNWLYPRRIDLFHGTDARLPGFSGCALVATFHDVFSMLGSDFMRNRFREMKKERYLDLCNRAHLLFAVSASTKSDMVKHLGVTPNRVHVVPNAVFPDFSPQPFEKVDEVKRKYGIEGNYLLFVGQITLRKNVTRIVHSFGEITRKTSLPLRLVIVGKPTYGAEEPLQAMADPKVRDRILHIPFCSRADLVTLYSGARVLLFPTLYEGFGLPVLESMACGTPVVTSNLSSLPEVAGDAALLVDPVEVDEIVDSASSLLSDESLYDDYRNRGLERVKQYTWENSAREALKGYQAAVRIARTGHNGGQALPSS